MMIRKFAFAAAAAAAFTAAFAAPEEEGDVSGQGVGAIGWTPVQIGLFAPVSYPWGCDWDLKGFGLDLFYTENVRLQGMAISGVAARSRDERKGLFVTGLCNWSEEDVYGVDLTLGLNLAFKDVYGIEAGLFGMRRRMDGLDIHFLGSHQVGYRGVQLSGLCNFTLEDFTGADVALGLNMAKDMTGAQLGGINFAHRLTGCQIGFFNIAEECPGGIQLGLVNIIMDNKIKVLPITNFYF
ncbi:MAG: hypothetical protein K6G91_00605 [Kiritimatiellae bacterium]|nr:hypothetical protein [Kiritimatiellia bacterium]